ncbi:hypothetical protein BH09BAC5_BH09BAC5_17890 [soil metagenome]
MLNSEGFVIPLCENHAFPVYFCRMIKKRIGIPQIFSVKNIVIIIFLLVALPGFSQKHNVNKDSLAIRDSIREFMFRGALLSMDALQSKYESQKTSDPEIKKQKSGESQNLFFQSRAFYRKAISFDAGYFQAWTNMGTTYYMQDLPKDAITCYNKALEINKNYSPAWYNLGKVYNSISKIDSAKLAYTNAIRTDSTNMSAYQELSYVIMSSEKDTTAALKLLRLSAVKSPKSEVPWVSMSVIYFDFKDSILAISALEKAAAVYPGNINRLRILSEYFSRKNDKEKSKMYQQMLAVELKKQEIPADKNADE